MDSSKEDQDTAAIDLGGLQTLIVVDFYMSMISWKKKKKKNEEKIKN